MAFEKEKRINRLVMLAGLVTTASGVLVCFAMSVLAGIIILIPGISLLAASWTIYNVFYKMKMKEIMEKRMKTNER
ncbi:MAG: hypothetical protein LBJ20_00330 [Candidatus Methanoplasma sp.]|nr:hypothetical protein [Candidatus Methanoplasma sp.]